VVYHDLEKMGEVTGEDVNFGFGYYMMTNRGSARGKKIDPRMYRVEFLRLDEKNPDRVLKHAKQECP